MGSAFEVLSNVRPTDLLTVREALRADGVEFNEVTTRSIPVAVVSRGWTYGPVKYDDIEELCMHITASMFEHASQAER